MYAGYTESPEKIEARKRRILASYRPASRKRPARTPAGKPASRHATSKVTLTYWRTDHE